MIFEVKAIKLEIIWLPSCKTFDLTSFSMFLVWLFLKTQVFLRLHIWFLLTLHIWLFILYITRLAKHLCTSLEKYSGCGIYLCFVYLSRYEVIIFERHSVTKSELLIERNKTSFFVKLLTILFVLVRVLARWQRYIFDMLLLLANI